MEIKLMELPHHKGLPLPEYQTKQAAGMDLSAANEEPLLLHIGEYISVPTGLALMLPKGYEAQVRPRSGLAAKYGITVLNSPGTVDADYRGEICVLLINHGKQDFLIERGMRIAQLIIAPIIQAELELCDSLEHSERGSGGFGHTGI